MAVPFRFFVHRIFSKTGFSKIEGEYNLFVLFFKKYGSLALLNGCFLKQYGNIDLGD